MFSSNQCHQPAALLRFVWRPRANCTKWRLTPTQLCSRLRTRGTKARTRRSIHLRELREASRKLLYYQRSEPYYYSILVYAPEKATFEMNFCTVARQRPATCLVVIPPWTAPQPPKPLRLQLCDTRQSFEQYEPRSRVPRSS